ncbi:MAG TPA: alpha-glucan family phosphorylase [Rubricoccaceae bacterium]|jgi:starch phosphorylase
MPETPLACPRVAYFSMEFGLDDSLKLYAGGLGILAGDHLKGAHDLGLPLVGIGILWRQGYVRQTIDADGQPADTYRSHTYPADVVVDTGVEVTVPIQGDDVRVKVWKVEAFGNAPLYLLDTDLPGNPHQPTTWQLYGGSPEVRVAQEVVLGIGGVRALRALGLDVDVYHFNEGHALLAAVELVREKAADGSSLDAALAATREEVVFTTHTPIPAGNETHPIDRLTYVGADLGLGAEWLEALGGSPFNMTVGALRMSRAANAVAQLHGETARDMWKGVDGAPHIGAITNGIHVPTWVDPAILDTAESGSDEALWSAHQANKRALIAHVEAATGTRLAEDRLLVGFGRRAVGYKRPGLIFEDDATIGPLLREGRLQLVFSGKSHPLDAEGKAIVAGLVEKAQDYGNAVAFVPDYSMATGALMTRGADVWLNNPRRPKEASGTSGMKAAMNGVLNASVLDGWWPEACQDGVNGWDIGGGFETDDEATLDAHDRTALVEVVARKVLPLYETDRAGWIAMMRASVATTRDAFSVERMLRQYVATLYTA